MDIESINTRCKNKQRKAEKDLQKDGVRKTRLKHTSKAPNWGVKDMWTYGIGSLVGDSNFKEHFIHFFFSHKRYPKWERPLRTIIKLSTLLKSGVLGNIIQNKNLRK